MHILILSQYYDPEPIPKPVELAQELQLLGHEVSVVTGFPNYPSGQLYPGYKLRFMQKTRLSGINVTRTYEYPYHGKSALGRIINYVSFMISAPFSLFKNRHFDVIYVWHPPLTVGIAAWIISVITRTPFVYDVQDIWPESVVVSGLVNNELVIKIISCIEKFVYRKASSLFVVTKGARENLIEKGVPEDKISVMPHWIDEKLFVSVGNTEIKNLRQEYGFSNRFVVMFAGNLGTVQGLDTIISAAENLIDDEKILFVFVGSGSDESRIKALVKSKNLNGHVCFIDRQPIDKIPQFLAAADVLLVHLKSSDLSDYVIPSKTTAYLAAGKPIIMAAGGAAAEIIEEINAGVAIEPENPFLMAEAIRNLSSTDINLLERMGECGHEYFLSSLSKKVVIPIYNKALVTTANTKTK
jgi:glycosyltransferase involved in cell wall biosynthesis